MPRGSPPAGVIPADQVKAAREARGLTQATFGQLFGVARATANRWEQKGLWLGHKGNPTMEEWVGTVGHYEANTHHMSGRTYYGR